MSNLAYAVKEAQLHATVEEMAQRLGWQTWHDNDSRRNDPGFPDLVLAHPDHGVLWLELKTMRGRIKPAQQQWIDLLTRAGQRAYVVRPSDMDRVEAMLRGQAA